MLYVARSVHMPSGEEYNSKILEVSCGRVLCVKDFLKEESFMTFVDEVYLSASSNLHSVNCINKEIHVGSEPLFAYVADVAGNLLLLE